jgi:glyoxylase-like metal-dependent hydrolase (beta-lactamase superfamily II)
MHARKLDDSVYMIDLMPQGVKNFISVYIVKGEKTVIIESGPTCSVENLLSGLQMLNISREEVDYVLVSHIHLDHGGGSGTLLHFLPNAHLVVHQRGAKHMVHPEKLWLMARKVLGKVAEMYGAPESIPKERIIEGYDGMILDLGNNVRIEILETVGHASHHLSFHEHSSNKMFSGDAAGIYLNTLDVIVPTTPEPLYLDVALAAIEKMIRAKPEMLCYTHFGCAGNAVEKLEAYASQLKLWERIVRECLINGESLEVIRERIVEEDVYVNKAASFIESHPIMGQRMLLQNIQGFVSYVKRKMG